MKMRLGGVQAHSYPQRVRGNERTLGGDGCGDGIGRTLENDKEGVALSVDLVSTMGLQRFAEETPMLRAEVTVGGTVPARKLRRALDVAKEESHGAAWQTSIHTARWYARERGPSSRARARVDGALATASTHTPE
jgi:hypothetical protein